MCSSSISKVNEIGERVCCKYGKIEVGIEVYMDDMSPPGDVDHVTKGIRNCA